MIKSAEIQQPRPRGRPYNGSNLCKCIDKVHKLAQYPKNYKPFDIAITVSFMVYYLGYVARHDQIKARFCLCSLCRF